MCKHCDSDWEKPLSELDNEDGQVLVIKKYHSENLLYLKTYGQLGDLELAYDINYCPICGRKLGEDYSYGGYSTYSERLQPLITEIKINQYGGKL